MDTPCSCTSTPRQSTRCSCTQVRVRCYRVHPTRHPLESVLRLFILLLPTSTCHCSTCTPTNMYVVRSPLGVNRQATNLSTLPVGCLAGVFHCTIFLVWVDYLSPSKTRAATAKDRILCASLTILYCLQLMFSLSLVALMK